MDPKITYIECFNQLRMPKIVEALQNAGYEVDQGLSRIRIEFKTYPPRPEELQTLEGILGPLLSHQPRMEVMQ